MIVKRKKPEFRSQDYFRYKKLGEKWRKPRGRQSKLGIKKAGSGKRPSIGYSAQREIKNKIMHENEFLMPFIVSNPSQLEHVPKGSVAVVASIGMKKAAEIAKKAESLGIKVYNRKKMSKSLRYAKYLVQKRETEKKMKELKKKEEAAKAKETKQKDVERKIEEKKKAAEKEQKENVENQKAQNKEKDVIKENKIEERKKSQEKTAVQKMKEQSEAKDDFSSPNSEV
ncbi:MAG: eL32 family ribosomal protein [Candidatus Aenigmatarchaeota archaeon]